MLQFLNSWAHSWARKPAYGRSKGGVDEAGKKNMFDSKNLPSEVGAEVAPTVKVREKRYQFSFSAVQGLKDKIDSASALLSNRFPKGKLEDVLEEVLAKYIVGSSLPTNTRRPLDHKKSTASRYIPKATRQHIEIRSNNSC